MIELIKQKMRTDIQLALLELDIHEFDVAIEKPKQRDMGDFAVPFFALSKTLKKAPQIITKEVLDHLNLKNYQSVVATGGYLNFFLHKSEITNAVIQEVVQEKANYGDLTIGHDKTVIVEYSSPNIAKPFHIGHIRTTLIGAALYRIFKKGGYKTIGINHLGDYGTQFGKLIVAIKLWGDLSIIESNPIPELLKLYQRFHDELEAHPDYDEQARQWFSKLENNDPEAKELWQWICSVSLEEFNRVYDMFGIKFDAFTGESFYSDKMPAVLEEMRAKNILTKDDGAEVVNLEAYNMPNALITKKDGSTLYITRDITTAIYRHNHYHFDKNIYVVGHQQELHFKQFFKIIEMMGYDFIKDCVHVPFGTVSLEEGALSTRKGIVVFLEDVLLKAQERALETINEKNPKLDNKEDVARMVGIGAVVFQELYINRKKDYAFSWDKTLSFEGETGPYLQYTCVRINSLLKQYENKLDEPFNLTLDVNEYLWTIVLTLLDFEEVLKASMEKYDPSLLAKYIIDLAQDFNKYYAHNKFISDDEKETLQRLKIAQAVQVVLLEGLRMLGLEVPKEM